MLRTLISSHGETRLNGALVGVRILAPSSYSLSPGQIPSRRNSRAAAETGSSSLSSGPVQLALSSWSLVDLNDPECSLLPACPPCCSTADSCRLHRRRAQICSLSLSVRIHSAKSTRRRPLKYREAVLEAGGSSNVSLQGETSARMRSECAWTRSQSVTDGVNSHVRFCLVRGELRKSFTTR